MNDAMNRLQALQKQMYALQYALNLIDYDAQTVAPSEGYAGRGEALEVLSASPVSYTHLTLPTTERV